MTAPRAGTAAGVAPIRTLDGTSGAMGMPPIDDDDVLWLLHLLEQEDLVEIEVAQGDDRVLVRAQLPAAAPLAAPVAPPPASAPAPAAAPTPTAPNGLPVPAPMAGIFYRAPAPDADPFVEVGDRIEAGQVVGLIEAMKLFNEVISPVAGTVTKIVVENQQRVEADQPLMYVQQTLRQD